MKHSPPIVLTVLLALLSLPLAGRAQPAPAPAPQDSEAPSITFATVEVFIDAGDEALAAYQLMFNADDAGSVRIVGIEGGAHPVFAEPPYYDPAAMQSERVVIAAFSTADAEGLPRGATRVATIHVQYTGGTAPVFETALDVAATVGGREIDAKITWNWGTTP